MSNVITTYKNTPFSVSDFPACKLFLPLTEGAGDTVTDVVGNQPVVFDGAVAGDLLWSGNYAYTDDIALVRSSSAETLPDLGTTKDHLAVLVADFTADAAVFTIGSGTSDPLISMDRKTVTPSTRITDSVPNTDVFLASGADANTEALMLYTDRNNVRGAGGASSYIDETDGSIVAQQEALALTAIGGMDLNALGNILFSPNINVYGFALFSFIAPPGDTLAALSWMNYQWRQGNKVIYPGWRSKT